MDDKDTVPPDWRGSVRYALKRSAEKLLVGSGLARLRRAGNGGERMVLAYHNVVPDGEEPAGDRSLHLPRSRFAEQMDHLLRDHRVVPLDRMLEEDPDPGSDGMVVAITFDDAYRGTVTSGIEELAKRGLPGTIFVSPALLGGEPFWWDALATADGSLPRDVRKEAIESLAGDASRILAWARDRGHPVGTPPRHLRSATEKELRGAARVSGITLASHGWSHRNLATLGEEELASELEEPLRWLRQGFGSVTPWLSYPYGRWSPRVERAAEAAGYEAAVTIEGGRFGEPLADRFAVPRMTVAAGLSIEGFELRTSGVLD